MLVVKKKKTTWRYLFLGCCRTKNMDYEEEEEQTVSENVMMMKKRRLFQRLSLSDISDPSSPMSVLNDLSNSFSRCQKLHVFTLMELRVITRSFSRSNMLGEGGFGPVFKGFVDDKLRHGLEAQPVAVKALDLCGLQGHREWLAEIIFLGQLRHKHLVKLIGFCCEEEQRLLVYEYMSRGSLEHHLFRRSGVTLAWSTRMKIALGAAKGLAFLHQADKPVIYRDFKTSNILLDSNFNAKLSDFGLAKDGPEGGETHVTTRVMGTRGYAAPEYIMTGHLTTMSDVYSFGVVLLELITGKRSTDNNRPLRERSLVEWARPILKDPRRLDRVMDPKLEGQYSTSGAQISALLAHKCLSHQPKPRPTMNDVVKVLESIQEDEKGESETNNKATFVCVVSNHNGEIAKKCLDKKKIKYSSYKLHRHVDVVHYDSLLCKSLGESEPKNYQYLIKKKKKG